MNYFDICVRLNEKKIFFIFTVKSFSYHCAFSVK